MKKLMLCIVTVTAIVLIGCSGANKAIEGVKATTFVNDPFLLAVVGQPAIAQSYGSIIANATGMDGKVAWSTRAPDAAVGANVVMVQAQIEKPKLQPLTIQWLVNEETGLVKLTASAYGDEPPTNIAALYQVLQAMADGRGDQATLVVGLWRLGQKKPSASK